MDDEGGRHPTTGIGDGSSKLLLQNQGNSGTFDVDLPNISLAGDGVYSQVSLSPMNLSGMRNVQNQHTQQQARGQSPKTGPIPQQNMMKNIGLGWNPNLPHDMKHASLHLCSLSQFSSDLQMLLQIRTWKKRLQDSGSS